MFDFLKKEKKPTYVEPSFQDIKKRARILIIDDDVFQYLELFRSNGYNVEHWKDVDNLDRLERGDFDVILLDIQGVGKKISDDQGAGVLQHLKRKNPSQLVIAYSNADFTMRYQQFFSMADASLEKSADYSQFQLQLDDLLKRRFDIDFYCREMLVAAGKGPAEIERLMPEIKASIVSADKSKIEALLGDSISVEQFGAVVSIFSSAVTIVGGIG